MYNVTSDAAAATVHAQFAAMQLINRHEVKSQATWQLLLRWAPCAGVRLVSAVTES